MNKKLSERYTSTILAMIFTIIVSIIVLYNSNRAEKIANYYSPLIDATMEVKLEAAIAHLWFEEIISGDSSISYEQVMMHIDESIWYTEAMLYGGKNEEGNFLPIEDATLQQSIKETQESLMLFRKIAERRWLNKINSGIGSDIDQEFDEVFYEFIDKADQVETVLQSVMKTDQNRFTQMQYLLLFLVIVMGVFTSIIYYLNESKQKKIVNELSESSSNLQSLLDNRGDSIWSLDLDYNYIIFNSPYAKLFFNEYGVEIKKGMNALNMQAPEIQEFWKSKYEPVFQGESVVFEFTHKLNGADEYFQVTLNPIISDGVVTGASAFSVNITEAKKNQLSIQESEKQFRSLIEQSGDGMFLSDFDGNIINVNKKACESLGYERSELLKLNISDVDVNYTNLSAQQEVWKTLVPGDSQTLETQHKRKDGELITVELTFGLFEYSNKKAILGFARDIRARKQADEILKRSEVELKEAQRVGKLGSWYLNLANNAVTWTEELYRMYNLDPTIPPPTYNEHQNLFTPESWEKLNEAVHKTTETGIPYEIEIEVVRNEGSNRWLLAKGEQVKNENGIVVALRGIVQDVTERKKAEDTIKRLNEELENKVDSRTAELENKSKDLIDSQNALLNIVEDLNEKSEQLEMNAAALEAVNKELESFSYSVSHDLRAPLRGINGFSLALLEDYADVLDDQGKNYLNRVRMGSQKMALLIDEMLNLSRLGRMALKPTTVNLSEITHSISDNLHITDPNRSVEIIIEEEIHCFADQTLSRAVIQNLLENAWKFTSKKEKAKIEFGILDNEGKRTYFVKDNGAGFNMEYKDKLFTAFQRLHQESEFPGTGIGLTTVQRIINRHNGELWAEGEIDKGATFYFTLNL